MCCRSRFETGDSGRADQAISAIMTIESVLTTACEITAGQIEPERSRIQAIASKAGLVTATLDMPRQSPDSFAISRLPA